MNRKKGTKNIICPNICLDLFKRQYGIIYVYH